MYRSYGANPLRHVVLIIVLKRRKFSPLAALLLIEMASSFYTLYPGDIISTGTPEGVSPILPGDHVVATVEGIGTLEMDVRA